MLVTNCCVSNYREQISLQMCTHVTGKYVQKKAEKQRERSKITEPCKFSLLKVRGDNHQVVGGGLGLMLGSPGDWMCGVGEPEVRCTRTHTDNWLVSE